MSDPLADYRRKRDFAATPEPQADQLAGEPTPRRGNAFVVHRHEARQLHYDLRIEHAGVLQSWAVPRGFSYDPKEKRLAMRTEDHPLEYEHFHGRIPKGQYGAGTMTIWDRGSYELVKIPSWDEAFAKGEIKIVLRGRRLRGEWHLVRTQQAKNSWLLFKSKDRFSGPDRDSALGIDLDDAIAQDIALPFTPMRHGGERAAFRDPQWLFEMQFEGQRALLQKVGDAASLVGIDRVPKRVALGLSALRCDIALLDGVLVALDPRGHPSRAALDHALADGDDERVAFYAFDLLQWEEYDLRQLPLVDRKAALRAIVTEHPGVLFVDHVAGDGQALLRAIADSGLPAAIGKRATSPYQSGPSEHWLRIPVGAREEPASAPPTTTTRTSPTKQTRFRPTNLGKVYWPAEGYTKGDLIAYYGAVADVLLPHLHNRPVHFNRFPDGIDGKSFYQREVKEGTPDWVTRVDVPHDGEMVPHHVINDRDTLLYAANLGSIDLHPWLSSVGSFEEPDYAVLDLDPKDAPWQHVVRIARAAGKLLRGIGLRPLLKTSGKTGMHIFVPLQRGYTYDHAKMFFEAVARVLLRDLRDIATVERLPQHRDGKVYLDFLQNRKSQTIVPPYSARPVRGASVSAPLFWDELEDSDLTPQRFTIQTMPQRTAEHGDLFHKALTDKQDLMPAIAALEEVLKNG